MDVHTPKGPIHGWRAFVGEVGIIVLGVLIALAAEQVVQQLHWREKTRAITEALKAELTEDDGPQVVWVLATRKCRLQQLDRIEAALAEAPDRTALRKLTDNYPIRWMTWDSDAYQLLQASDVSGRISSGDFAKWAGPYRMVHELERLQQAQRQGTADLHSLGPGAAPLSPEETLALRRAVASQRELEQEVDANAGYYLKLGLGDLKLAVPPELSQRYVDAARRRYGDCVEALRLKPNPTAPLDFRFAADALLEPAAPPRP